MTDIMTPPEAADILDVHADTIRRWCARGKLQAKRIDGRWWAVDADSVRRALIRKRLVALKRRTA